MDELVSAARALVSTVSMEVSKPGALLSVSRPKLAFLLLLSGMWVYIVEVGAEWELSAISPDC